MVMSHLKMWCPTVTLHSPGLFPRFIGPQGKEHTTLLPSVKLFCSTELEPNQEIFYRYFPTDYRNPLIMDNETKSNRQQDFHEEYNYEVGEDFQETRRRLHLFLPGASLRKWCQEPLHQEKLAKFLQARLYQHYIDDYFWRSFSAPSPYSHLYLP